MKFFSRRPLYYSALLLVSSLLIYYSLEREPANQDPPSGEIKLRGFVDSQAEFSQGLYGNRRIQFVLKTKTEKLLVYVHHSLRSFEYGDELELEGRRVRPHGVRNPGGFNQREFLAIRGIHGIIFVKTDKQCAWLSQKKGWAEAVRLIHRFRGILSGAFLEYLPPREAGFMSALIFGERSDIDRELMDHFTKTGTLHLLAVSGFNVGFVIMGVWMAAGVLRIPKDAARIILLAAVWAYCFLVGWQSPVLRATVMATIFILGSFVGRKSDVLNALGAAALVILLINPRQVMDLGFQLSFAAVLAIALLMPVFMPESPLFPGERRTLREKVLLYISELFWVSFICLAATLPLTAQSFYVVTPAAVFTNMIVVPLTFVLFCLGILYLLAYSWAPQMIAGAITVISEFLVKILSGFESLPGAYLIVGKLTPWLLLILLFGLAWLLFDKRFTKPLCRAAAVTFFCINVFLTQEIARGFEKPFSFTMLDVGQGDALFFQFPRGTLLIDAGKGGDGDQGRYVIAPFLKSKGIRQVDTFVVSHPQEDHIGGAATVLAEFNVHQVLLAGQPYPSHVYEKFLAAVKNEKAQAWTVSRGSAVTGYPGAQVRVLHPQKNPQYKNINDASVVLEVEYGGRIFLLTGDIQEKAIEELTRGFSRTADVLKVPHHGARLKEAGQAWVRSLRPEVALISAGENNRYGHPHPDTMAALESLDSVDIYRTDRMGAVEIRLRDGAVSVHTGEAIA